MSALTARLFMLPILVIFYLWSLKSAVIFFSDNVRESSKYMILYPLVLYYLFYVFLIWLI